MTEWKEKTLGEVTSFVTKGIPPKYSDNESPATVWVLNQKCNRNFDISYSDARLHDCNLKKVPENKMLKNGDVLINSTGTGTAGRVAQLHEVEMPTTIDGHMILLRPTDEIDPMYYGYAIKAYQSLIESLAEGSTGQTEINRQRLQDEVIIRFPVNKCEQRAIGSFLANLDEKIKTNNEINKNLEEQAQIIYEHFVLNLKQSPIPISDIIDVRDGTHDSPKAQTEGYPLVTSKHLLPFGVDLFSPNKISKVDFDKVNERSKVDTNDILLSMIGTVGLISLIIESSINFAIKNVGLFKTSQKPELVYYILCYLKNRDTKQYIETKLAGSTQKYISLTELRKLPIIIPNQSQLADFNSVVTPLFLSIANNVNEMKVLSNLRDTFLPKLMTGELDVSNIDI